MNWQALDAIGSILGGIGAVAAGTVAAGSLIASIILLHQTRNESGNKSIARNRQWLLGPILDSKSPGITVWMQF